MSLTINQQAVGIQTVLTDVAESNNGVVTIASDLAHMWKMAYQASDKLRIIVVYTGEEARGPFSLAAATFRVDRQFTVMVTRGRGFAANREDSLTDTVQNALPFYDLVDNVRNTIRAMIGVSVELPVDFKAIRSPAVDKNLVDAYMIDFSLAADLPRIVSEPVDLIAIPPAP